jgi:hypothetical protein
MGKSCEINGRVRLMLFKKTAKIELHNVETTVVEMYGDHMYCCKADYVQDQ